MSKATAYPAASVVGKDDKLLLFPSGGGTKTLKMETLADAAFGMTDDRTVNPNLLTNWYFKNPVNQRGVTTGSVAGQYMIDRWYARGTDTEAGLTNDGFLLGLSAISQAFDDYVFPSIVNKVVTFSVLNKDGELATKTITVSPTSTMESASWRAVFPSGTAVFLYRWGGSMGGRLRFYIQANAGSEASKQEVIVAAKLELGDHQTLAHKEGDIWVLNEIPDPATELVKCQRYYQKGFVVSSVGIENPNSGYLTSGFQTFQVQMRKAPTLKITTNGQESGIVYKKVGVLTDNVVQPSGYTQAQQNGIFPIFPVPEGLTPDGFDTVFFYYEADAEFY